jgi:imidazolonepropionase-like amidohydrolase
MKQKLAFFWLFSAFTLALSTESASAAPNKCAEEIRRSLSNATCEKARAAVDLPSSAGATSQVVDDGLVIEDVTLISPERPSPVPHLSVVIRNGRIAQIAPGLVAGPHATRINGQDRFLIPGLIDSHVHVGDTGPLDDDAIAAHPELLQAYQSQLPRSFLAFGFTTLVDLNSAAEDRARFIAAPVHPNLYHCGAAVHVLGGYGAHPPPKDAAAANAANLVYQPAQVKDWPAFLDPREFTPARDVDRVVQSGGVCVKVFVEPGFGGVFHWPVPSAETLAAFRLETSRRGLVLIIHANAVESWQAALDAHADVIAHGLWHWPGDRFAQTPSPEARQVIHQAALAGVHVQPTLQVIYGELSIFDRSLLQDPRFAEALPRVLVAYLKSPEAQAAARAMQEQYRQIFAKLQAPASMDVATAMSIAPARVTSTLRIMLQENVKLLFGSDTASGDGGIGNPPGLNERLELSRWAEAGVPLSTILRASTLDNAVAFGLSKDLGTIEVGKRADLLLLRADPLQSVAAYDSIDTVILNGTPLPRASLLPAN